MVVGNDIDRVSLVRASSSLERLEAYCVSLVPKCLRHIDALINNQKYFVALELRNIKTIEFKKRNKLANELIKDIYVSGTFDEVIFVSELFQYANMDTVFQYIFREELKNEY